MPDTTARLALPVLLPAQAQKHVTHNEALQMLDGMVQLVLAGLGSMSPPAEPVPGALYALGVTASGAWAGQGAGSRNGQRRVGCFSIRRKVGAPGT